MRRRTLLAAGIGCGIGLTGCGGPPPSPAPPAAPTVPPPPSVLPDWKPVALLKAARRIGRGVAPAEGTYYWRTEQEVLFLRPGTVPGNYRLSWLAVASGKEQPLQAVNPQLKGQLRGSRVRIASPDRPGDELRYLAPAVSLSPEGKWLLWYGGLQWTAAALEGTERLQWRQPSPLQNPAVWLRDGRYWAELEADARDGRDFLRRVFVHDVENPLVDRTIETPALEAGAVLGFTPEGRLLVQHPNPVTPAEETRFTEVEITSELGVLRPYTVRLPRPGTVVETVLSPEGDRLAWVLAEAGEQPQRSLWLSRWSGEDMTLVGAASAAPASPGTRDSGGALQLVRWLPRGDALSFVAGGALYTLALAK